MNFPVAVLWNLPEGASDIKCHFIKERSSMAPKEHRREPNKSKRPSLTLLKVVNKISDNYSKISNTTKYLMSFSFISFSFKT